MKKNVTLHLKLKPAIKKYLLKKIYQAKFAVDIQKDIHKKFKAAIPVQYIYQLKHELADKIRRSKQVSQRNKHTKSYKKYPVKNRKKVTRNACNPGKPVVIYDKCLRIIAKKGGSSLYKGKTFYHNFHSNPVILGMPDGSLSIRSRTGKRLWNLIKQR